MDVSLNSWLESNKEEKKREAHRAAMYPGSVRLKRHVGVHCQLSICVHVHLRTGLGRLNTQKTMPSCQRVALVTGAQQSTPWRGLVNSLSESNKLWPQKTIGEYQYGKVKSNLEWDTHRAAMLSSSVGLTHHILVHLQHSPRVHVNLS